MVRRRGKGDPCEMCGGTSNIRTSEHPTSKGREGGAGGRRRQGWCDVVERVTRARCPAEHRTSEHPTSAEHLSVFSFQFSVKRGFVVRCSAANRAPGHHFNRRRTILPPPASRLRPGLLLFPSMFDVQCSDVRCSAANRAPGHHFNRRRTILPPPASRLRPPAWPPRSRGFFRGRRDREIE
jgi:hypothetical protein